MKYPEFKWVEYAYGGAANRGNICEVGSLPPTNGKQDCYRTIFRYDSKLKEYHEQSNHSVRGYKGVVYADCFPLDIDEPEDQGKALEETRTILNTLLSQYELDLDTLWLFFSGSKGFHVMIPAVYFEYQPSVDMPSAFKHLAGEIAGNVKIDTTIYDHVRLFRVTNSINSRSGLYKVPLTPAEILHLNIGEIKNLARRPRTVETKPASARNTKLGNLYRECLTRVKRPLPTSSETSDIPAPKNAKLCYCEILKGVGQGMRDNAAHRLAVHFLKEYPEDMVSAMMHAWNRRNDPPMDERAVDDRIKSATSGSYDYGCNDPVLSEFCAPHCRYKGKAEDVKITADKVYTLDEAKAKYEEYIRRLKEKKITLGFGMFDRYMRGIAPGEVCEVMARTGVGKTAFLLNVIRNVIRLQHIPILFFSLEQPLAQIYERAVQISSGETGGRVEEGFMNDRAAETLHSLTKDYYGSLYVVEEDMLTYEELKEFIDVATREKIGRTPPLVCVDYLGRMKGGRGNAYEVTSELARLLKKLAKELEIAVLYLHQTSRAGGTGAQEISLDMGRDSGVIEEAADFIIGMWRPDLLKPEFQDSEEERIVMALLKNRKGRVGRTEYMFQKKALRIIDRDAGFRYAE